MNLLTTYAKNQLEKIDKNILTRSMYGASPEQLQPLREKRTYYQTIINQMEKN